MSDLNRFDYEYVVAQMRGTAAPAAAVSSISEPQPLQQQQQQLGLPDFTPVIDGEVAYLRQLESQLKLKLEAVDFLHKPLLQLTSAELRQLGKLRTHIAKLEAQAQTGTIASITSTLKKVLAYVNGPQAEHTRRNQPIQADTAEVVNGEADCGEPLDSSEDGERAAYYEPGVESQADCS